MLVSVSRQHLGAAAAAATAWLRSLLAPPVGTCPVECAAQACIRVVVHKPSPLIVHPELCLCNAQYVRSAPGCLLAKCSLARLASQQPACSFTARPCRLCWAFHAATELLHVHAAAARHVRGHRGGALHCGAGPRRAWQQGRMAGLVGGVEAEARRLTAARSGGTWWKVSRAHRAAQLCGCFRRVQRRAALQRARCKHKQALFTVAHMLD